MNKHEKQAIKTILMEQIASMSARARGQELDARSALRLERLNAALNWIEALNFGECFKCDKPIPTSTLRVSPERIICDACLE